LGLNRDQMCVFRPSEGEWHIKDLADGRNMMVTKWGIRGDIPLEGKFNGNKSTIAVYRSSEKIFYFQGSPFKKFEGNGNEIPVAGSYVFNRMNKLKDFGY